MKKIIIILALLAVGATATAQKDTIRVLAIGNSFSQDCVEQYLYELSASDGGPELVIGNLFIGGCTIQRHWKSITQEIRDYQYRKIVGGVRTNEPGKLLIEGLLDEKWDVISFQHGAGLYGLYDTFFPEVDSLVAYVRANAPKKDFQLLFNEVWSFPVGTSRVDYMAKYYDNDTELMYRSIVDASERIAEHVGGCKVVPVGTAIWNLRHTWDKDNCYRDGFHLNNASGRYTAACTWYEALTGRSPVGNAYYPDFVTAERALVCQHAAHAAVATPTKLSNIGFRKSPVNYDESKVPAYTLPDALVMNDGSKVRNARQWTTKRRGEILELFENEVYGKAPGRPEEMTFETLYTAEDALGGLATRREVRVYFSADKKNYMTLLIYAPAGKKASPAFLGINFKGNESICDDPGITLPDKAKLKGYGIHPIFPRGYAASSWPVEEILRRGYAVVTFCRDDVDPDTDDAFGNGVHPLFYRKGADTEGGIVSRVPQRLPDPDQWGTIAAWAWGLSRAMDYLETDEMVDAKRVAVIGHSRLGKTALWAAALDTRFAMSISNCSGCGGAALSRRAVGETVAAINRRFPHWFCRNFQKYNDNEAALPVDQHELIDLIAPRPVYIASASEDKWADPVGEGLAAAEAAKVYKLFHATDRIGRHVHEGKHNISIVDWAYYLDFADKWLGQKRAD